MSEETLASAQMLKQLRDATGLGLLECKSAIEKENGNPSIALISLLGSNEARMIRIVNDRNSPVWVLEALVSLNNSRVLLELSRSGNDKQLTTPDAVAIANKFSQQKNESDLKVTNEKNARDLQSQVNSLEKEVKQIKTAYNELLKTLESRDKEVSEALAKNGSRRSQTTQSYSYFAIGEF